MRTRFQRFALAIVLAAAYLYAFPYFEKIRHANELPRIYLTMAMVDEGTVAIDTGVKRWGKTADVSDWKGHSYSNKAPGQSILAVPAYLVLKGIKALGGGKPTLAEMTWVFRVFGAALPSLLFFWLLWRFTERYAPMPQTRRTLLVGYALGTMAFTYSTSFMSHHLAAICIGTSFILFVKVIEDDCDQRWLFLAGAFAGAAPLVDYQAAFAGVPIAVYVLWKLLRREPRNWRGVGYAIAGSVPPILTLLAYHDAAFDSPFRTGYDASTTFAHFHQQGFLGIDQFRGEAFWGSLGAADNGLFFLSPMLLLAIPGWVILYRKRQLWAFGTTLSIFFIYVAFISSINFWRGGWQMGPRYITAALPFMLIPIAAALREAEDRWVLRGACLGLVGASVVVYATSCVEFPHWPEVFANPVYEVTFRLIRDGYAPYNAGWLVGLRGFASLVPYFLLVAGALVWAALPSREHKRSALLGAALTVAIVALMALAPGGGKAADATYERVKQKYPDHAERVRKQRANRGP